MVQAITSPELVDLLIEGARYGDAEDVKLALDQGASIDCRDEQGRTGTCWQVFRLKAKATACYCATVRDCACGQGYIWQAPMGPPKSCTYFCNQAL